MVVTYKNTRTGRLAEVDDDKLVVLMDRSTRWERVEAERIDVTPIEKPPGSESVPAVFDPSEHGVREIRAYLADADADERARVLQAEAEGKARRSILT